MNKIFKYFTVEDALTVPYITWFVKKFPVEEFKSIDKILYLFLEYCSVLGVIGKRKYLLVFLSTDLAKCVKEYNIRVESLTTPQNYDEASAFAQAVELIRVSVIDSYDSYVLDPIEEDDNFKVFLAEFMKNNMKDRVSAIFMEEFSKIDAGNDIIDVAESTRVSLGSVRDIYDIKKISDLDFITGSKQDNSREEKARLVFKTGVPAIDEDYGGIFSKALITYAGQPGYGKTRLLMSIFVYPALVDSKVGVRFDELELAEYEVKNMLVSIHVANIYKIKIPDRDINRDDLTTEQKRIVESARIDLFESGKYGRFMFSNEDLIIEEMLDDATNFFKLNRDVQVWAIDYIGLIKSKPKGRSYPKEKSAIIDESLVLCKSIAKKADIAAILVNQFNDDGNKAADMGKPIMVGMIQGGQSVQRHSDFDIAMTATQDQYAAKLRMISTTKARAAVGFQFVPLQTDLSISRFTQISKLEDRS